MVDLGSEHLIMNVLIYNRWDECCRDRLNNCELQILDANSVVVASQPITNGISINDLDFASGVMGRYVRIQMNDSGLLNLAEVMVMGLPSVRLYEAEDSTLFQSVFPRATQAILEVGLWIWVAKDRTSSSLMLKEHQVGIVSSRFDMHLAFLRTDLAQ